MNQNSNNNFILAFLSLTAVIVGCIWNSYELEMVVSHPSKIGKGFGYGLTVLQCIGISIVGFIHFLVSRMFFGKDDRFLQTVQNETTTHSSSSSSRKSVSVAPSQQRNDTHDGSFFRLSFKFSFFAATLFWLSNTLNNIVFQFGIAVPIMQVIRSSSLLTSAVVSYFYVGKKFSLVQIFLLICITAGIAFLSLNSVPAKKTSENNNNHSSSSSLCDSCGDGSTSTTSSSSSLFPDTKDPTAVFRWFIGLSLCIASAFFGSILGMVQDRMFREAKSRFPNLDELVGVTEEAIFRTHLFCLFIFSVTSCFGGGDGVLQPVNTFLYEMPESLQKSVLMNILSQYSCIWGVFTLSKVTTAFLTTMATTVRKFLSLVMSLVVFGHATQMSWEQLFSIGLVTISVSVYPFVKGPATQHVQEASVKKMDEKTNKKKKKKKE